MRRKFIYLHTFEKAWKAMGLTDDELSQVENSLLSNPQRGVVIEGTGGARKMRVQLGDHGKSGGGRVIYLDVFEDKHLYMIFAYPKNVQEDLTPEQTKLVRKIVSTIKKGE